MPFGNFWNRKKSQDPQPPKERGEAEERQEATAPESSIPEGPGGGGGSNGDDGDSGDDQPQEPPKGGWRWLKGALSKTRQWLKTDIRDLFKSEGRLVDEAFLEELFALLVKSDMGAPVARQIRDRVQKDYRGRKVDQEELLETLRQELRDTMQKERSPLAEAASGTTVILVVGVNGSGKTTSIAKLAYRLTRQGKRVLLGAGDTFRAAAVEQLKIWSERIGCDIVLGDQGSDPAAVAHRACVQARDHQYDVCILDTAGRLQTQVNLMQQLEKIRRVIGKQIEGAPHEVLLVLDATAGQNALSQAKGFSDAAGCTGIVLAKLDGSAKGGVVVPILKQFGLPVKFVGLGEKLPDFAEFDPESFTRALFDLDEN
ncbi:MAG: signal recognition particle-docking protein FtsY [Pirellulaceae bacterium]|jgi:fused signal recognition particle receptor